LGADQETLDLGWIALNNGKDSNIIESFDRNNEEFIVGSEFPMGFPTHWGRARLEHLQTPKMYSLGQSC
jgi:hypothetical protein